MNKSTTDTPRTDAVSKRYITIVYEITDENEWRKTNPLRYAHNGLSAVRVSVDDACELLDEATDELEEIRSALGDDGRRTHKEILELATKASQWREWKEKYIDLKNAHIAEGQDPAGTIWEHADKLQKELKEAKAEVESVEKISEIRRKSLAFAINEMNKADAEVERLKAKLYRAIEIARGLAGCGCGGDYGLCNFCADQFSELDQLKATLNQTDK